MPTKLHPHQQALLDSARDTTSYSQTHGRILRDHPPRTMPVETANGTEQRPIDTVRIDRHGQRVEPTLRPGEEAFHSIDGRCHVIDTGNRN